jgi:dipeptidyl-peptidase-4
MLTNGDWTVTSVVHVDEAAAEVWFTGTADGVTERHLYRVPMTSAAPVDRPERMTHEPGWHEAVMSPDGSQWVDTWSSLDTAPRVVVRELDGGQLAEIHAPSNTAAGIGLSAPQLLELTAADSSTPLRGLLYRAPGSPSVSDGPSAPPRGDGSNSEPPPPCVVWIYGGPHSQYAANAWDVTIHPLRQLLARHGVAVLVVDNRGTANRGIQFERVLDRHLGTAEIDDQLAAVVELARRGEIDPERVGITGGSYGGYVTLLAMARHPDVFRVGVAVAPVGDWRGYDTAYTERYLGTPDENAEAYREASAVPFVGQIRGDLLLIHGVLDENVHLSHSVQVLAALQAAGRDVELLPIPDQRHRLRGEAAIQLVARRTATHLLAGLGVEPSDELLALGRGNASSMREPS